MRPDPPARIADGPEIPLETARRLACDATVLTLVEDALGRPLGISRRRRVVPRRLRRLLQRRDGGCRFPGCTTDKHVDAHHVWFWADGGPTDLDNLIMLCRFHHTLVHEGGFTIALVAPGRFTFHRPDGSLITVTAPAEPGDAEQMRAATHAAGATPSADSLIPDWDGSRQDIDTAIAVLHHTTHGHGERRQVEEGNRDGGVSAEAPDADPDGTQEARGGEADEASAA